MATYDDVTRDLRRLPAAERLGAFRAAHADALCHVDYWRIVADIWRALDAPPRDAEPWRALWERAALAPGARQRLMADEERARLGALPATVTVHRAFAGADWRGFGWTRDRARAEGRARAWGGRVATATVPRDRIVALFARGEDDELVLLPGGMEPVVA
jgi:hypothetical protein